MEQVKRLKEEVRIKGKTRLADAVEVDGKVIIITGGLFKTARIRDEWYGEPVGDADVVIRVLRSASRVADIFTFVQWLPQTERKYDYCTEWVPLAVVPVRTFDYWWENQIPGHVRKSIRRAQKRGVICKLVTFDDEFARGITRIYNECPVRQGKQFWHFGKDFETVQREAATYLEKSEFIGAYLDGELIGFIKMLYLGQCVSTMHVISMIKHRDKSPTNALLAKAIEVCADRRIPYFNYGEWIDGSLGDFKRYNGFERVLVPRYFVPLTMTGRIAISLNLQHGMHGLVPTSLKPGLVRIRRRWNSRRVGSESRPA